MTPALDEIARYYDRRYAQPPGAMRDFRLYLDLLEPRRGGRVLDIGCGEGFFLEVARQAELDAFGLEITLRALQLARVRAPDAHLAAAAGEALPFPDEAFDHVACLGTLEHFADPRAGAREIARVLRPEGNALIVVPNRRFLVWTLRGRAGTEQQAASELLLDAGEWQSLLEAEGLRVVRLAKEPWYSKPFPERWKRVAVRWMWRLTPLPWTYQFAFVCRR